MTSQDSDPAASDARSEQDPNAPAPKAGQATETKASTTTQPTSQQGEIEADAQQGINPADPVPKPAGGNGGNIKVKPEVTTLGPGGSQGFKAVDQNETPVDVTWQVIADNPATAGSINVSGQYQAPETALAQQSIIVKATDKADSSRTAQAEVTLTPPPSAKEELETPKTKVTLTPPLRVTPATPVVLGAGRTVKFEAKDASETPVDVTWSLIVPDRLGPDVVGSLDYTKGNYTTYTAPQKITVQRFITILATGPGLLDKVSVVLAPGKVTISPGEVTLRASEVQEFRAHVSGDLRGEAVTWSAPSPAIGQFEKGKYTAPANIGTEDRTVIITATADSSGDEGYARITLLAGPWSSWGAHALGLVLMLLFIVVIGVGFVWPPPLDRAKLNAARTAARTAQQELDQRQAALQEAVEAQTRLANQLTEAEKTASDPPAPALVALRQEKQQADENVRVRTEAMTLANKDHNDKEAAVAIEKEAMDQAFIDERNLFLLVVLAGALGSFVHTTRSFADFAGNRSLRKSWLWWYLMQPFTGSALAVVVYLVIRGGFFAGASASQAVNPFGFVAVASLVGLFAKQATNKLDELFSTMFRTDKERELKDKLDPRASQPKAEQPREPEG